MKINVFKTVDELLPAVADFFATTAQTAILSRGEFNVALSGGTSPLKLYELLASPDFRARIDWHKVNFFFGDERYVPKTSPENNAYMVKKALFDPLHISASKIFSVDTTLPPHQAARNYSGEVFDHFEDGEVRFDLILLGLGANAHTASLFPYTSVLDEKFATIKAVYVDQQIGYRITMTAPLINQARHIAFLVFGEAKHNAVFHVLEGTAEHGKYPAQLIQPAEGDLQWFMDEAAASKLTKRTVT